MLKGLDSLTMRLGLACVTGLIALQILIAAIMLWPADRPTVFRLISPGEAARIAEALEQAPAEARPAVLRALNTPRQIVRLENEPIASPRQSAAGRSFADAFERYGSELGGRPFAVQTRAGRAGAAILRGEVGAPGSVRIVVGLRTGGYVAIERVPVVLQALFSRGGLILGGASLIVILTMGLSAWQVGRPINRLALAASRMKPDGAGEDLIPRGPLEVRRLTGQFNALRLRIRELLDTRTRELAAIAHDLRTYITRLRLRVEFIEDADERRAAVADIDEMTLLLDDTLLFAREAQAERSAPPLIDVAAAVADLVAVRAEAGEAVQLVNPSPEPVFGRSDPVALRRILNNLIDNALRYGGTAWVNAGQDGDGTIITVDDDGSGVPEAALETMTIAFERLEPSRNRDTGGAGLGLTIVKALVESQGGIFRLSNRRSGGLRAEVRLQPRAAK